MKRVKKFVKQNIIGFVLGLVLMGVGVVTAATIVPATGVSYSNSNSSVTNVNEALDELFTLSTQTNNSFHIDFYSPYNKTHVFPSSKMNVTDYDISTNGGYLNSSAMIVYPSNQYEDATITLTVYSKAISLIPYWFSSNGSITRSDTLALNAQTVYNFKISDFGDDTCIGIGFYQYAVTGLDNDDKLISVDIQD